jgi:hypothetical protein
MANADVLISGINNVLDEKAQEDLRSSRWIKQNNGTVS